MAFVSEAWDITVVFRDRDRNTSVTGAFYANNLPFVDVEAAASAFVAAIGALSDAPIVQYRITRAYRDDAAPQPPETSDVERKGYFFFRLADSRGTSISVPSIKNTLVVDNTNVINTSDPLVAAFVAAVQTSGTDAIGTDIVVLEKAEKRHRGSRKG